MLYDKLVEIIETNLSDLAYDIAVRGLAEHLPAYQGFKPEPLGKVIEPTVAMVARTIRTGSPDEYRDYSRNIAMRRLGEGKDIADVLAMAYMMFDCIKERIERELPGSDNAATRDRFNRRLDGIRMLGTVSVNAARAEYRKQKREKE